jgi:FHS family L-fucose permease-like MFS transporter
VYLFRLPTLTETTEQADHQKHTLREALSNRHVLFGVLAIFFYVGAEVAIGSLMVNYFSHPDIGRLSEGEATTYLAYYWGLAMIGRFAGSALMVKVSPRLLLAVFATMNMLLLAITLTNTGHVAIYSLVAIGLFNSIMFPTIFALSIERLGPLTNKASSLLIMAIVGGAIVPLVQGVLADKIGLHHSFVVPLLCYAYIIFFGVSGSRLPAALKQGA